MTPLEKAARAGYEKNPTVSRGREFLGMLSWDELGPWQRKAVVDALRAALEALLVPTEEMLVAGRSPLDPSLPYERQASDAGTYDHQKCLPSTFIGIL